MYPRNAASPERIAIGAVVQISDGAVQTSGCTVTVRGQGGAEAGSAGTIAYGASGIVYYTPTQGETDFTSFVVIASKTGCIPVSQTIITSASATPGHAGLDWGKVINPSTTVNLSATTVNLTNTLTTYTGNTVQTGDAYARLGAPAGASVSADILAIDNFVDGLETTIGAAGAGLTAVPWNAAWDAEVQSEVDDALVAQRLDELLNADSDIDGAAPPTVGSVFHELMTKTPGSFTYSQTTDSLEALKDTLGIPTFGDVSADINDLAGQIAAISAAAIADAVWDEDATAHQTGGTFGQAIGDPGADTNTIFKAVVSDATGATVGVDVTAILVDTTEIGVAGAGLTNINLPNQTMDIVGNITGNLSGSVGSVAGAVGSVVGLTAADVGAIKAKTDSLAFTVAGLVDANVQAVNDVTVNGTGALGNEWGP